MSVAPDNDDLPPPIDSLSLSRQASYLSQRGKLSDEHKQLVRNLLDNESDVTTISEAFAQCDNEEQWDLFQSYLKEKLNDMHSINENIPIPEFKRQLSDFVEEGLLEPQYKEAIREIMNKEKNEKVTSWMRDVLASDEKRQKDKLESMPNSVKKEIDSAVQRRHDEVIENWALQAEELSSLIPIFEDEISINQTRPLCLIVSIHLQEVECVVELGFLLPPTYPTKTAVIVSSYIPPPFCDKVHASKLNKLLRNEARDMIGDCSIFCLVEEARTWICDHITIFQSSGEQIEQANNHILSPDYYSVVGPSGLSLQLTETITKVQNETGMTTAATKAALKKCLWNSEKLLEEMGKSFFENKHEAEPGMEEEFEDLNEKYMSQLDLSMSEYECVICLNTASVRRGACLKCKHFACIPCWNGYLTNKIDNAEPYIGCPGMNCNLHVDEMFILPMVSSKLYMKYRKWLYNSFLSLKGYKWCPNVNCNYVGLSLNKNINTIFCPCKTSYCYTCLEPRMHWPAACGSITAFENSPEIAKMRGVTIKLSKLESSSSSNLTVYTKPCPKCHTRFEKNEGCNHMKCFQCGYHFCWVCLEHWGSHTNYYKCSGSEKKLADKITIQHTFEITGSEVGIRTKEQIQFESKISKKIHHLKFNAHFRRTRLQNSSRYPKDKLNNYVEFLKEGYTLVRNSVILSIMNPDLFYPKIFNKYNEIYRSLESLNISLEHTCQAASSLQAVCFEQVNKWIHTIRGMIITFTRLIVETFSQFRTDTSLERAATLLNSLKAKSTTSRHTAIGQATQLEHLLGHENW